MTDTEAWLAFKAKQDNPALPSCPFCGIRHTPSTAHPFCDKAMQFKAWKEGKP